MKNADLTGQFGDYRNVGHTTRMCAPRTCQRVFLWHRNLNDQTARVMSSEAMVSFLRKVAPGVEQSLQQNETVDIFQVGFDVSQTDWLATRTRQHASGA